MKTTFPVFALLLTLLSSCNLINPPEETPAFLRIDSISVDADYARFGSSSDDITEAWVFLNGQQLGVFDLPLNVPVLEKGQRNISVLAGIKRNGRSDLRVDYPFYTAFETQGNFSTLDTTIINPVVDYFPAVKVWNEDFEDPGIKLIPSNESDANLTITTADGEVFEGEASGIVQFSDSIQSLIVRSDEQFNLPSGRPVFLEINYKTETFFEIGVVVNQSAETFTQNVGFVKASNFNGDTGFKKIYMDLSSVISQNSSALSYEFYIAAFSVNQSEKMIFDNIKIVYP